MVRVVSSISTRNNLLKHLDQYQFCTKMPEILLFLDTSEIQECQHFQLPFYSIVENLTGPTKHLTVTFGSSVSQSFV